MMCPEMEPILVLHVNNQVKFGRRWHVKSGTRRAVTTWTWRVARVDLLTGHKSTSAVV
jgi:hypothetical protein